MSQQEQQGRTYVYEYDKSVYLIYQNGDHRGPGKVVRNLKSGLSEIGFTVEPEYSSRPAKYTGCLQFCYPEYLMHYYNENKPILLGPNLFVLPNENPSLCKMFDHFVVPSQWIKELYLQFDEIKDKNLYIWPVGIDVDCWSPEALSNSLNVDPEDKLDCFIYFKNRSKQDLAVVEAICKKFKLKYDVIKYGNYEEKDLWNLCTKIHNNNGFCILLTGTESQGIAYMQILSSGIPCYVFNNPKWKSENGLYTCNATSVPYFDERCGYKTDNINLDHFSDFTSKVKSSSFNPREYILENHTLEKAAEKYVEFLKASHEKK